MPEQAAKTAETSQIPEVVDESLQVVDETLQVLLFLPYSWFTLKASILLTPVFFFSHYCCILLSTPLAPGR